MQRIGVILAAGRGRRMGRTKQLEICETAAGPKPLVAAAFDAIRPICDAMVVVVGHEAEAVVAALGGRELETVAADAGAPMFESIRAGLRAALAKNAEATAVVQPGDHPEVSAATLAALVDRSLKAPGRAVMPEFRGRGGHPVLIPSPVAETLIQAACPGGLGEFWAAHPQLCERVRVDDAGVVRDVDRPADLTARPSE